MLYVEFVIGFLHVTNIKNFFCRPICESVNQHSQRPVLLFGHQNAPHKLYIMHFSQFTLTPNGTYLVGEATELDANGNAVAPDAAATGPGADLRPALALGLHRSRRRRVAGARPSVRWWVAPKDTSE